jgi:hypothetical protein
MKQMEIILRQGEDGALEHYRPKGRIDWKLVSMGTWSQTPHHGGAIVYSLANPRPGLWLLKSGEWSDEEDEFRGPTDYDRIVAVALNAPASLDAARAARLLYKAWTESPRAKVIDEQRHAGLLDLDETDDDEDPEEFLAGLPDTEARRQAVAEDLRSNKLRFLTIPGIRLAELLGVTPGSAAERIHLCAINRRETAEWINEQLHEGEPESAALLGQVLSPTRRKALRRYLAKVEEGEDVTDFVVTPRELKRLAPLRAKQRVKEGEIEAAWSYDSAVAPDGTELRFTFEIGEEGEVEDCLSTPYEPRPEPDSERYAWE